MYAVDSVESYFIVHIWNIFSVWKPTECYTERQLAITLAYGGNNIWNKWLLSAKWITGRVMEWTVRQSQREWGESGGE